MKEEARRSLLFSREERTGGRRFLPRARALHRPAAILASARNPRSLTSMSCVPSRLRRSRLASTARTRPLPRPLEKKSARALLFSREGGARECASQRNCEEKNIAGGRRTSRRPSPARSRRSARRRADRVLSSWSSFAVVLVVSARARARASLRLSRPLVSRAACVFSGGAGGGLRAARAAAAAHRRLGLLVPALSRRGFSFAFFSLLRRRR